MSCSMSTPPGIPVQLELHEMSGGVDDMADAMDPIRAAMARAEALQVDQRVRSDERTERADARRARHPDEPSRLDERALAAPLEIIRIVDRCDHPHRPRVARDIEERSVAEQTERRVRNRPLDRGLVAEVELCANRTGRSLEVRAQVDHRNVGQIEIDLQRCRGLATDGRALEVRLCHALCVGGRPEVEAVAPRQAPYELQIGLALDERVLVLDAA